MTFGEMVAYVRALPAGSALAAHFDPKLQWDVTQHLLARVVDELAVANFYFVSANHDGKGAKPEPPKPVQRPGAPEADGGGDGRMVSAAEARQLLAGLPRNGSVVDR